MTIVAKSPLLNLFIISPVKSNFKILNANIPLNKIHFWVLVPTV